MGFKLTNIHRGIKFEESQWLEKYIVFNTELRTAVANEFEKDFFKLMNNSVFGKTMENIRNRVDIKLVNTKKQAEKLSAKPNFNHCNIFSEDLVAIHVKKTKLVFNKPVYLGMCILDLSKTLMYDFHYNYIKQKYGDKAKLLFTDIDSLTYEIQTEDFHKDISADVKRRFDTSDYPPNHPSGIPSFCWSMFRIHFWSGFGPIWRDESCNDFIPGLSVSCFRDVNVTLTLRKQLNITAGVLSQDHT